MSENGLEQFQKGYVRDTILELGNFLVYMKDRTSRIDLFADNQRKMNIVYHQLWAFRQKLIKNFADKKNDYDVLPKHLYSKYKKDAEQSLKALIEADDIFRASVSVPKVLAKNMEHVVKKLEDMGVSKEGLGDYYVTKEGDQYLFDGVPVKAKIGLVYRKAFDIIFDVTEGKGGVCEYDRFARELKKRDLKFYKKLQGKGGNSVKEWAQLNLTVKTKGILSKVPKKDLLETKEGVGFIFNNKK